MRGLGNPAREGPFVLGVPIPIQALKAGVEDWVVMVLVECVCSGGGGLTLLLCSWWG